MLAYLELLNLHIQVRSVDLQWRISKDFPRKISRFAESERVVRDTPLEDSVCTNCVEAELVRLFVCQLRWDKILFYSNFGNLDQLVSNFLSSFALLMSVKIYWLSNFTFEMTSICISVGSIFQYESDVDEDRDSSFFFRKTTLLLDWSRQFVLFYRICQFTCLEFDGPVELDIIRNNLDRGIYLSTVKITRNHWFGQELFEMKVVDHC